MDDFKQQIRRKLIASVIVEKCAQSDHLIFRDAWCTQERVIRFTTPFFRQLFPVEENTEGYWETGDSVMYEALNGTSSFLVNCVLSLSAVNYDTLAKRDALCRVAGVEMAAAADAVVLKSWDLTGAAFDPNDLFEAFDELVGKEIPRFEQELKERLEQSREKMPELHEGTPEYAAHLKYERSKAARDACIAAHGAICAVCGFDFGQAFGPEFAGKIEVHHIVPLSQIKADYVVDPVKDLVPVCPNCHTALHSKKDGVYTVEELKQMREGQKR